MIVDLHTHLLNADRHFAQPFWNDLDRCGIPRGEWRYTEEAYLAGTAAADRVVVFGLTARKTGWHGDNRYVADFVRRHPEKYIFFTSIDPLDPDYMDQLCHDHAQLGAKGLKIGPVYQGLPPTAPQYYRMFEYCQAHGLPVITHMATTFSSGVPLDYARPVHMDQVAVDFPGVKFVLAHLGHPWSGECVAAVRHQPNLYADLSALYYRPWQFYQTMMTVQEYGIWDKVLFGSDFPATTTASSLEGIRGVNRVIEGTGLPPVNLDKIEEIIHRNALELLGIE